MRAEPGIIPLIRLFAGVRLRHFAQPWFPVSEVTAINKQKFLVELGRLLTFMSDEDRQEALTLYEKMFDDARDEQSLLQALVSPTRQAVIIARAYDANARKLQAYASAQRKASAHEDPEATPEFVHAILRVYEDAVPLTVESEEEPASAPAPVVEEEGPELSEVDPDQLSLFEEDRPAAGEDPAENTAGTDLLDEVDSFIANFSIAGDELSDADGESRGIPLTVEEELPAEADSASDEEELLEDEEEPHETERKARPLLLLLFILFAVPLTVAAIAVLLVPTLLSLVLAAAAIVGGCALAVAAFSGFAVFADILIVLGCAIVLLALGLLFLWLFVWFVSTVIGGLIRWVVQLGSKWCYKEVAA